MATITHTDGSITEVRPNRAIRLWLVQQGKKPSTPELKAYLATVKSITFEPHKRKAVNQERLPYND